MYLSFYNVNRRAAQLIRYYNLDNMEALRRLLHLGPIPDQGMITIILSLPLFLIIFYIPYNALLTNFYVLKSNLIVFWKRCILGPSRKNSFPSKQTTPPLPKEEGRQTAPSPPCPPQDVDDTTMYTPAVSPLREDELDERPKEDKISEKVVYSFDNYFLKMI